MTRKRTKNFIDRSVQGSVLLRLVAHWMLFLVTAGAFLFFVELLTSDPRDAGRNVWLRYGPVSLTVIVLGPIFLHDLCKVTNRIAGPILRLRKAMRELADGQDVAPIEFREGDFWQDLAVEFNRVLERVQTKNCSNENHQVIPNETHEMDSVCA